MSKTSEALKSYNSLITCCHDSSVPEIVIYCNMATVFGPAGLAACRKDHCNVHKVVFLICDNFVKYYVFHFINIVVITLIKILRFAFAMSATMDVVDSWKCVSFLHCN